MMDPEDKRVTRYPGFLGSFMDRVEANLDLFRDAAYTDEAKIVAWPHFVESPPDRGPWVMPFDKWLMPFAKWLMWKTKTPVVYEYEVRNRRGPVVMRTSSRDSYAAYGHHLYAAWYAAMTLPEEDLPKLSILRPDPKWGWGFEEVLAIWSHLKLSGKDISMGITPEISPTELQSSLIGKYFRDGYYWKEYARNLKGPEPSPEYLKFCTDTGIRLVKEQ